MTIYESMAIHDFMQAHPILGWSITIGLLGVFFAGFVFLIINTFRKT